MAKFTIDIDDASLPVVKKAIVGDEQATDKALKDWMVSYLHGKTVSITANQVALDYEGKKEVAKENKDADELRTLADEKKIKVAQVLEETEKALNIK